MEFAIHPPFDARHNATLMSGELTRAILKRLPGQ
jgi:hypothetical protein